jgi:hypothetical protein
MAVFSISDASAILKNIYLPPVREVLNNATPLLKYIEKETQDMGGGTSFIIPLHTGRNDAAGDGSAENATLRAAGKQAFNKTTTAPKYLYSRLQVSGPVIAATKSNKGAFLKALESEMKYLMQDTKRAFNRQLHSDGVDAIGYYVSGTGTTTGVMDDGIGNRFDHLNKTTLLDLLDTSASYALLNTATTATRGALVATGRQFTTDVNISASASAAGGAQDIYVKSGTFGNQMMGIAGIISPNNPNSTLYASGLQGLTIASEPDWSSQVIYADGGSSELFTSAGRQDVSFEALQDLGTAISVGSDADETDVNLYMSSPGQKNKYVNLCRNERVFFNNMKLDGGFSAVSYNGKPWVWDPQCKKNRIYAINFDTLVLMRLADLDWIDVGGDVLYRISGGDKDAVGATLFVYQELAAKVRNQNGVILNLNE